jgi:hypothetical protein
MMQRSSAAVLRPRAIETAPRIPLAAAGRQPLFFFGTLMDLDVLAHVLARPVEHRELEPARLRGFARVRAKASIYPVLVPHPAGAVEGRLLRRASRRDIERLNLYESEGYRAELRPVRARDGAMQAAWLYLGLRRLGATREPWRLGAWQRRHKRDLLAACPTRPGSP